MTRLLSNCPSCGDRATRTVYDIGDGPEVSCASCEWCWPVDPTLSTPDSFPAWGGAFDTGTPVDN